MTETGRHLTKVATLDAVRELTEGKPVELWIDAAGKVVLRAYNECGNRYTEVDLLGLLNWSRNYGNELAAGSRIPALPTIE